MAARIPKIGYRNEIHSKLNNMSKFRKKLNYDILGKMTSPFQNWKREIEKTSPNDS